MIKGLDRWREREKGEVLAVSRKVPVGARLAWILWIAYTILSRWTRQYQPAIY